MFPFPKNNVPNPYDLQPPEPPEPKYRFRWGIFVGVPLTIAAVLFVVNGIDPSFQFQDIMKELGVLNQPRYVRLACLCVLGITVLLIAKLFRNKPE